MSACMTDETNGVGSRFEFFCEHAPLFRLQASFASQPGNRDLVTKRTFLGEKSRVKRSTFLVGSGWLLHSDTSSFSYSRCLTSPPKANAICSVS